jgi:hypothetical protein
MVSWGGGEDLSQNERTTKTHREASPVTNEWHDINTCGFFSWGELISVFYPSSGLSKTNSNMTSFFRFANKRASYPFGIISLAHAPVNVTDFSIGSIHFNRIMSIEGAVLFELHNLCVPFSASVNINYRLPIKVCYRICTLRHIRIEINHGLADISKCYPSLLARDKILIFAIPC